MKPTLLRDHETTDVSGWLMSEKLDGWRMLWTGSEFVSRSGKAFDVPAAWLVGMPDFPLDGELFAGRGKFNQIQGMIRDGWEGLSFQAFDVPSELPFVDRVEALQSLSLPAHCELVKHETIASTDKMKAAAWRVILSCGGEGVVVRNPASPYKSGRDQNVLRDVPRDPAQNRLAA